MTILGQVTCPTCSAELLLDNQAQDVVHLLLHEMLLKVSLAA